MAASRPPATRPMNWPDRPAIWLVPSAKPRFSAGHASTRIAAEFAISMDPPMAWGNRQPISHIAPPAARNGSKESMIEARVKTTKPAL